MDDYTESALTEFASDHDATVEEVKPAFEDKLEEVESKAMEALDDQQKVDYAISMLSAEDLRSRRIGNSGEPMELKILAIGHRGVFPDWGKQDIDTVMTHAIIHGPLGEDGTEKAAKAILFNKKTDLDLLDVQNKYHALNELKATYEVEEAWDLGEQGFYRCYSTEETELAETDLDDLPSGRDDKNSLLRRMFDDVPLSDLGTDGTGLSAYDADSGYTLDWGADIKRFTGTVQDYYVADDNSFGRYTLMDDSVTEDDIEDTAIVSDQQNVPGLTVFAQPDYHIKYGNQSVLDGYGTIEVTDDGEIIMRAAGVVPIIPMDLDDGEQADDSVQATESSI